MKGMAWESPRGPISIDPETRDIIQNIYIRKVEKKDGELWNIEFETIPDVKDPVKAAAKINSYERPGRPAGAPGIRCRHSALMPETFTTLAHFSMSLRK